jgi:threonylcarbamoyladenosine tRNA methylthiotransferase MtaB
VPLQNGDAAILSRMNRHYTPAEFTDIIRAIRQNLPAAAIGVDIMVGFPGETEAAFGNTVSLLEALPVTYLHVFPFSPRPGTRAAAFPDPVDPRTVKKRRDILLALGRGKKSAFYGSMTGKTLDVLIEEERDPRTGLLTGISENYVRVLVPGADTLKNRVVPCRITGPCGKNAVTGVPW